MQERIGATTRRMLAGAVMLLTGVLFSCVEPYDPEIDDAGVNHLVVNGFLNATDDSATVELTRTQPVKSAEVAPVVAAAFVAIEDDAGTLTVLPETGLGLYRGAVPGANTEDQYRLVVRTDDGREYLSEFVSILETPPIDSVTWSLRPEGLEISVNSHDPSGQSRHFRWRYNETYEYNANYNSIYKFEGEEVVFRPLEESIFTCWRTDRSTDINVASTEHLAQSVVSHFPLTVIPSGSVKISVEYSIAVEQIAITEAEYAYWINLAKSTENLGGLFDPLPSEVSGNMRSVNNPAETVIGYFGGGTVQQARMFVAREQLPVEVVGPYRSDPNCALDSIFLEDLPNISKSANILISAMYSELGIELLGYTASSVPCGDCRARGGVTQKPAFWK